ncbi:MAG: M48 family metalloprotease [Chlorobiaceae bacterium]|nr:M48 family metalloprotease [Chlorobiaceae bacterium]
MALNLNGVLDAAMDGVKAVTLSDADVVTMSKQVAEYSDKNKQLAPDSDKYAQRLKSLVSKVRPEKGRTFNFRVYLTKEVNAFALADGSIRVYSGLMDMMDDHELRFVIGHEIGHVMNGDSKASVSRAYTISAVRKGVAAQGGRAEKLASSDIGELLSTFVTAQYSQKQEKAADDYGFDFMKRNGFKAASSVTALRKLATLGGDHSFLSSHPEPGLRASRLEGRLK